MELPSTIEFIKCSKGRLFMMLHKHKFEKIKLLREYYDYSGFRVGIFVCKCSICGKEKKRKYW